MTDLAEQRRRRLSELLDLAQAYKGWTRKDLAKALGRDPTKLVPGSGVPKLDLVIDLANVLDWPVGDMIELLWTEEDGHGFAEPIDRPFDELNVESKAAHREGRYAEMVRLAQRMYLAAQTPDERALASNRLAGGWDGLGRYTKVLEAVQTGLQDGPLSTNRRVMLEVNLANAHYSLWHLFEARATASNLLDRYEQRPPEDRLNQVVHAFAHYVRGHSLRRMIDVDPQEAHELALAAKADLERARSLYLDLERQFEDASYGGVANTCLGGLVEVETFLGERDPDEAIERITDSLDAVIDAESMPVGDWLESYGWWCIFGCNLALRHVADEKALQHHMAIFTNKADEIANRQDNWAMRERVFTMEFARRQRFVSWTGMSADWTIDQDDVRVVAGTMGRFPSFRRTGWMILQSANVIRSRQERRLS